jgi:hypothetical protein
LNCNSNPIYLAGLKSQLEDKYDKMLSDPTKIKFKDENTKTSNYRLPDKNASIYDKFIMYLRDEQYSQWNSKKENLMEYSDIKKDLLVYHHYISEDNTTIKRCIKEENIDNPYLRSKFIAAFLRSIYALLEFPLNIEIKKDMIGILYKDGNICLLSKLVDCTKLIDDNIASKYLVIMRHVLTNSSIYFENNNYGNTNEGILLILKIISYVISKIVSVFKSKLNLEENGHKLLLCEVSKSYSIIINELQSLNIKEEKKKKEMNKIVGIDVMMVFIDIIKKQMNHESDSFKDKAYNDKENLAQSDAIINEMVANISYIIGEYLSKCNTETRYLILECFTKSYIFEGVKMRKTYLKEIINYSKDSDCKSKLSRQNKIKVDFIIQVQVRDFLTSKTKNCLLAITHTHIEFFKLKNTNQEYSYWDQVDFESDEEISIPIIEIKRILSFDVLDRIFLKSQNKSLFLLFNQNNTSSLLVPLLKLHNPNIEVCNNIQTIVLKGQEQSNHATSPGESPVDEPSHEKAKPFTVIVCKSVVKGFFDFFKKIFGQTESKHSRKIVVIYENHLHMLEENINQWFMVDYKRIFNTSWNDSWILKESTKYFPDCYTSILSYDLTTLKKFTTRGVDQAVLVFNNDQEISMTLLDDLSYVKLKNGLFPFLKSKFGVTDNFHDNIK